MTHACDVRMSLKQTSNLRDLLKIDDTVVNAKTTCEYLPIGQIEHLLSNHPIMKAIPCIETEVHKCLTYMLSEQKTQLKKHKKTQNAVNILPPKCFHCKINASECKTRDGDLICSSCGVSKSVSFEQTTQFMKSTEPRSHCNSHTSSANVSKWLLTYNALGDIWNDIVLKRQIEHWNHYVNLPRDDLEDVVKIANWMEKRASNESRIAAAFLFKYMNTNYDLSRFSEKSTMEFKYSDPACIDSCAKCGETFFKQKSRRIHYCYPDAKREKSRAQWSLVKNKKRKLKMV